MCYCNTRRDCGAARNCAEAHRAAYGVAPKQGFRVPVEKWLAGPWRRDLDLLQSDTLVERDGYIQGPALRAEITRAIAAGGASEQLWYVAVLERWLRSQQSLAG